MGKCLYCQKSAGIFKKLHKECEEKYLNGRELIKIKSNSFFDKSEVVEIVELENIADNSFIPYNEFEEIMENTFTDNLLNFLDDGTLDDKEEDVLGEYMEHFKLTQEQLNKNDSLGKMVRASILRKLLNGEPSSNRLNIDGNLPFKFQKSEELIWLFQNVELYEQRIKTTYEGSSNGISLRIAKGVYYRTSSFRGHPVKTTNIVPIASGMVALTNKHIYFSSGIKNFRINYVKIITLEPYSDGIGITKDGVTAKPQVFKNVDGWFCYNFIKNISE
ncbi:hypothetical protein [Maribacter sp. LLG6340-A2]|uniref:hypothetical protein n=1 Tax=Maribacter sp. LLG6340-A2 TaxID=3160834 RepID=UPI0038679036